MSQRGGAIAVGVGVFFIFVGLAAIVYAIAFSNGGNLATSIGPAVVLFAIAMTLGILVGMMVNRARDAQDMPATKPEERGAMISEVRDEEAS